MNLVAVKSFVKQKAHCLPTPLGVEPDLLGTYGTLKPWFNFSTKLSPPMGRGKPLNNDVASFRGPRIL